MARSDTHGRDDRVGYRFDESSSIKSTGQLPVANLPNSGKVASREGMRPNGNERSSELSQHIGIEAPAMLSIPVFCRSHSISRALFYKLHQQGKTPPICKVGTRSLISAEDAAAWRDGLRERAA